MYSDLVASFNPTVKKWHPDKIDQEFVPNCLPFINYLNEDLTDLVHAKDDVYIDHWDDFRVGLSGGIIMDNSFMFIHTEKFSETARYFNKNGCYTKELKGTIAHRIFWTSETSKRRSGLTLNCRLDKKDLQAYLDAPTQKEADKLLKPLHITGDHYTYLNYGRMMLVPGDEQWVKMQSEGFTIRFIEDFPNFWDGDYWNFKLDEFIAINSYNLCKAKARSKGYSFKRASQAANRINLNPNIRITLAAYDADKYLFKKGATTSMAKINLDWFETETNYKRGYVSEDPSNIILGYKTRGGGHRAQGWLSSLNSVSLFGNPNAMVGGERSIEIDVEEAGVCPNLIEALGVTLSSTEVGSIRIGTIRTYGTGGTKEANWEPFKKVFYGPKAWNMLPMENVWDDACRATICGFFHPQVWNLTPFMDNNGNSLVMSAYYYDKTDKEAKGSDPETTAEVYSVYCAQRANKPAEAFGNVKENLFSSIELENHYKANVASPTKDYIDGMFTETTDGKYVFMTNEELKKNGVKTHDYINEYPYNGKDKMGCIRIYHKPYSPDGNVPKDLYDAVFDPTGKDLDSKELKSTHSLDCIIVNAYPNVRYPISDRICAVYLGRRTADETAKILIAMTEAYNCKVLGETDRGNMVADMKRYGKLHKLHRDPTNFITSRRANANAPYGINMGGGRGGKVEDAYLALKEWLYTRIGVTADGNQRLLLHTIEDLGILNELTQFSSTSGNYDRLSALRMWYLLMTVYALKKNDTKKPIPENNKPKTLIGQLNSKRNGNNSFN